MARQNHRTPQPASALGASPPQNSVVHNESPARENAAPGAVQMTAQGLPDPKTATAHVTADHPAPEPEGEQASSEKRPVRVRIPLGSVVEKLAYPPRPGFHRHWFNDKPMRVEQAKQAGYEHVVDDQGKPISRPVGTREGGGGLLAYLMEIPQEWRDEDMAAGQARVDEIDRPIREGKLAGQLPEDDSKRYSPKDSIRFETGKAPDGK